ncbi:MAG: hypothetical protein JW875_06220 [Spirochaetales bacterium]|nr:hypothetical protein [Spirochaetales bacterium]
MDNKSILVLFGVLIVVFVLAFTLSIDAIANGNVMYGIYAFAGFLILVLISLFESMMIKKEGGAMSYWFRVLSVISLIVLVWYSTRIGSHAGWW